MAGGDTSRFSTILPTDYGGSLWIVSILAFAYSFMVAAVRIHVKWGMFGHDDALFGLATTLVIVQVALVVSGLGHGLGRSNLVTEESQWEASSQAFLHSEIFTILALCFSKCSTTVLILRVFAVTRGKTWVFCYGILFTTVLWTLGSILSLLVKCNGLQLLASGNSLSCPNQYFRWQIITSFDVATEVIVSLLPGIAVSVINISAASKAQVFVAFAIRLPSIPLSIGHLVYLGRVYSSTVPQLAVTDALIFQQAMLVWSLVSATIPNMKGFMRTFSMEMGVRIPRDPDAADYEHQISIPLQTIGSGSYQRRHTTAWDNEEGLESVCAMFRPDGVRHTVLIEHLNPNSQLLGGDDDLGLSATGSQDLIIRKDMQWKVSREPSFESSTLA